MELSISLLGVGLDRSGIWRWDRGYSTAEQSPPARFAVHCAVCHQRLLTATRAHAQYIITVKGGGCKKMMRALMRTKDQQIASGLRVVDSCIAIAIMAACQKRTQLSSVT